MKNITKFTLLIFYLFFAIKVLAQPISPIPLDVQYNKQKALLGKKLFFDTKLSKDNTISCASCHMIHDGGDDNIQFSFGMQGRRGDINAPTILNAFFNFRQFWNGKARTLEEQVHGPLTNYVEMDNSFENVIQTLLADQWYKKKFHAIYPQGITQDTITDALAEFQKRLITPNAPFDKYLRGDKDALTQKQKKGYELFKSKGCVACHNGINIGGALYAKFGIIDTIDSKNLGLYEITKDPMDKNLFKVPTLRNIALTAPYFHDGKTKTLSKAVETMAYYQIGRRLSLEQIDLIVEFLHSLTGEVKGIDGQ